MYLTLRQHLWISGRPGPCGYNHIRPRPLLQITYRRRPSQGLDWPRSRILKQITYEHMTAVWDWYLITIASSRTWNRSGGVFAQRLTERVGAPVHNPNRPRAEKGVTVEYSTYQLPIPVQLLRPTISLYSHQ